MTPMARKALDKTLPGPLLLWDWSPPVGEVQAKQLEI